MLEHPFIYLEKKNEPKSSSSDVTDNDQWPWVPPDTNPGQLDHYFWVIHPLLATGLVPHQHYPITRWWPPLHMACGRQTPKWPWFQRAALHSIVLMLLSFRANPNSVTGPPRKSLFPLKPTEHLIVGRGCPDAALLWPSSLRVNSYLLYEKWGFWWNYSWRLQKIKKRKMRLKKIL